jgi:hypothetical protein
LGFREDNSKVSTETNPAVEKDYQILKEKEINTISIPATHLMMKNLTKVIVCTCVHESTNWK